MPAPARATEAPKTQERTLNDKGTDNRTMTGAGSSPAGRPAVNVSCPPLKYQYLQEVIADVEKARTAATEKRPPDFNGALDLLRSVHGWLSQLLTDRNIAAHFKLLTKDLEFNEHYVGRSLQKIVPGIEELMRLVSAGKRLPNMPMNVSPWDDMFTRLLVASYDCLLVINKEYVSIELAEAMVLPVTDIPAHIHQRCLTIAERRVLAWLKKYQKQIDLAEYDFGVSRIAIAGAIAWEALLNPYSPTALLRGPGPGKNHIWKDHPYIDENTAAKEVEGLGFPYPEEQKTATARATVCRTPQGAIRYIAAIMALSADIAYNYSYDIFCDAPILTHLYNSKPPSEFRRYLEFEKDKNLPLLFVPPKSPIPEELMLYGIGGRAPMGWWVEQKTDYLKAAVGDSKCYTPRRSKVPEFVKKYPLYPR